MAVEVNARNCSQEHILLCLSSFPANEKVIQIAARMADAFNGTLTALWVETSAIKKMPEQNRVTLHENSKLAEQLGARIATVCGNNIANKISQYAKANNVTKIVIGYSVNKKICGFCWQNNINKITSLVLPNVEVYVVN